MEFKEQPIITKADIKKRLGSKNDYAYTALNRLKNKGKLKKVTKGKYTASNDVYAIASNIITPSYISFWTASQLKGYTEQILRTIQIASTKQKKPVEYEGYKIEFHKLSPKKFFGFQKEKTREGFLFIAEDEKLVIDCLLHPEKLGNTDEIIKAIKKASIDKDKITSYLNKINNKSLNKRAGFLLEKLKGMDLSGKIRHKDKNHVLLTPYTRGKHISRKWMVKHDLD